MPYKKRRIIKSPNKNQEKSGRNQLTYPPLREYFPEVERLILKTRFSNRQGHILQDDYIEYGPGDLVNFLIPCPGGCGEGQTNLQSKIESAVRSRQSQATGYAVCENALYNTTDTCGCEINCDVKVVYKAA